MTGRQLLIYGRRVRVQLTRGGVLEGRVERIEADEVLLDIGGSACLLRASQIAEVTEPATWTRREEEHRDRPPGKRRNGDLNELVDQAGQLIGDGMTPRRRGRWPSPLSGGNSGRGSLL